MQLGRHEEAEKSFTQAWNTLKHLASENPSYDNLYAWARITYNIIDAYTSTEQFQQAESWLGQGEEAINKMISSPECSAKTAEEFIGGFSTHKALVYIKTGKRAEAEKAYQHFLSTNYSKTSNGLIEHSEYLEQAERWDELAKLTPKVDSVVQSWEIPLSLYYLKTYMKPYLMGYLKSGRKEEALKMAERMALAIDSVDSYERQHNAAELAIMYETQEKEKQIAEQQSQLQSQRYLSFLIAVVIILVSLIIIGYLRLRSAASLAAKNHELKQKNDELTLANKRAEESSRMKTDFIQQISHEIRTPLNILSGFTQVLTTSGMELKEAEKADINQRINENTHRITELVNKMLELSDIHSKTVIERSDLVSSVQIAAQATEESDIHQATHITFHLEYDEKTDKTIRTNFMSATRALALLLNNAAKFTKEGSVELRIERDKAASSIVFSVTDTGIGVPPYEAERIFQEFTQLDQYYDGTGIGLTVARSIARRLGGDIRLDPTYNNGARFLFSLPDEQ
jgi:signal transduction histidine kinase